MLASAATASAECAWVLWERRAFFGRESTENWENWAVMETYDSRAACREDHAKLLSGKTFWSVMGGDTVKTENGFMVIMKDKDGKRVGSDVKQAQCLPDTVDPRGPKSEVSDARLWHPWLRIDRVLRVMLPTPRHAAQRVAWEALKKRETASG